MCLTVKSGEVARKASHNILVKKIVKPIKSIPLQWVPICISNTGAYEFNKVLQARYVGENGKLEYVWKLGIRLFIDNAGEWYKIEEGFHSFGLFSYIRGGYRDIYKNGDAVCYLAVIPRGSEYAKGNNGDIVSTKIIVFSSFRQYILWKLKIILK